MNYNCIVKMYAEFVACYERKSQVMWLKNFVPSLKVIDNIEKH
jgi:hypothetical protein